MSKFKEYKEEPQLNIIVTLKSGETIRHEDVKPLQTKKEKQPEGYEEGIDLSKYEDELSPFIQDGTRFKFTKETKETQQLNIPKSKTKHLFVYRDDAIAGIALEKVYKAIYE